jgi:hypothetical protein
MSLPNFSTQSNLFSTAAVSTNLFGETDRYRLFAQFIYPRLVAARPELESCYCLENGRVAIEPVLLLGVSLLQYLDGQPDRRAVEMLRYHAGWNFALNRQLGEELFHPTSLVNFRQRLIDHGQSALGFQTILEGLVEAGLVARQSRQRLDSTHILGRLSRMTRLDCLRETLRLTLEELSKNTAGLPRPDFWPELWERYVESKLDFRAEAGVLHQKMNLAGTDAAQLLAWVEQLSDKEPSQGEQVRLLARVFHENFELDGSGPCQQREAQPTHAVRNPHDPEAQYAVKGHGKYKKEHVGYKVQVAETVCETKSEKGEPTRNFITAMATQPATASDDAGLPLVEQEQAAMGLEKAPVWHVDAAYISAQRLAQAQAEGRELIGPAQRAPRKDGRFSVEDFQIDIEQRRALCPAGQENTQCSRLEVEQSGQVHYRFEFGRQCQDCALRQRCVGKGQRHRTVLVGGYHSYLQARRQEQKTEAFKRRVRRRNAIEGTQSELVRGHGLRQARYRGLLKIQLQNYLTGAACNIKRWIRRQIWLGQTTTIVAAS